MGNDTKYKLGAAISHAALAVPFFCVCVCLCALGGWHCTNLAHYTHWLTNQHTHLWWHTKQSQKDAEGQLSSLPFMHYEPESLTHTHIHTYSHRLELYCRCCDGQKGERSLFVRVCCCNTVAHYFCIDTDKKKEIKLHTDCII